MGQKSEDGVRKPGMYDHSPLPYSLGTKVISLIGFVVHKGKARVVLARVVEKRFMEDRSGTLNDG